MPLTINTVPPVVLDYLREGNSKDDLIEWIWGVITDQEKEEILIEATNQHVGEE